MTQQRAAKLVGVKHPHLSAIIRGRLSGYSVEKLLSIINHLGRRVEVRIGTRDVELERAITAVHMNAAGYKYFHSNLECEHTPFLFCSKFRLLPP